MLGNEALCEPQDALRALAQGRDAQIQDPDPVIQVLPEAAVPHQGAQILVRRADYAGRDPDAPGAADPG